MPDLESIREKNSLEGRSVVSGKSYFSRKLSQRNGYKLKFKNRPATSCQHVCWLAFEHHAPFGESELSATNQCGSKS